MKITSAYYILGLTLTLGACSHYSDDLSSLDKTLGTTTTEYVSIAPQDIIPAAGGAVPFGQSLAREYYTLARYENDKAYDYKASKLFTEKAKKAAQGQITAPSRVASYSIRQNDIAELNAAREELLTALKEKNGPGNEAMLAKAQASYDCWLERAEEARDETHYAECKESYQGAMAALVAPAAGKGLNLPVVNLRFSQNSTILSEGLDYPLGRMAEFINSAEGKDYNIVITAYALGDPVTDASKQLAKSRALVIYHALRQRGIPEAQLKPQMAGVSAYQKPGDVQVLGSRPDLPTDIVQIHFDYVEPTPPPATVSPVSDTP